MAAIAHEPAMRKAGTATGFAIGEQIPREREEREREKGLPFAQEAS